MSAKPKFPSTHKAGYVIGHASVHGRVSELDLW